MSVDHDVFFASLGRPDLARKAAARHGAGVGFEVGGSIAAVAGVIGAPLMLYEGRGDFALAGLGLFVGGVIVRAVGKDMQNTNFPEDQALDMADRYNQALRAHLGLPAAVPATKRPPDGWSEETPRRSRSAAGPMPPLAFAPFLAPGAAGAFIGGRF